MYSYDMIINVTVVFHTQKSMHLHKNQKIFFQTAFLAVNRNIEKKSTRKIPNC